MHRMWGRLIGLAVLIPATGFWACGYLTRPLKARAVAYGGLVFAQGLLGMWMVQSGLQSKPEPGEVPRVSQYRLASHLGLALLLYSSMLYTALGILAPPKATPTTRAVGRLRHAAHAATGVIFLTALSGAGVRLAQTNQSNIFLPIFCNFYILSLSCAACRCVCGRP